jgi:molecular chaperone GrpE
MKSTPDSDANEIGAASPADAMAPDTEPAAAAAAEDGADSSGPALDGDAAEAPAESLTEGENLAQTPQQQLAALQEELAATRDRWLRAMADLENLRKRSRRELQTTTNLAKASLLRELLEVADNFGRAIETAPWTDQDEAKRGFAEGVRLTYVRFMEILRSNGLQRIEARGASFDPNLHEAISQIETDEVPSQHVVQVIQEGYLLNDMVVRPARVVVAV